MGCQLSCMYELRFGVLRLRYGVQKQGRRSSSQIALLQPLFLYSILPCACRSHPAWVQIRSTVSPIDILKVEGLAKTGGKCPCSRRLSGAACMGTEPVGRATTAEATGNADSAKKVNFFVENYPCHTLSTFNLYLLSDKYFFNPNGKE